MSEGNVLNGFASCKNDEQGGIEEVFRMNRCYMLIEAGHCVALCPACNWLEQEYLWSHLAIKVAKLRQQGFHLRFDD